MARESHQVIGFGPYGGQPWKILFGPNCRGELRTILDASVGIDRGVETAFSKEGRPHEWH